jgi:hypothetical protein
LLLAGWILLILAVEPSYNTVVPTIASGRSLQAARKATRDAAILLLMMAKWVAVSSATGD